MRVLIVDDEPLARAVIRRLLAGDPDATDIEECASGVDAVAAITRHRPDLVILDIEMPELNGFGVVRAISATGSRAATKHDRPRTTMNTPSAVAPRSYTLNP